eukprot:1781751-Prymnesium_polylepis.1
MQCAGYPKPAVCGNSAAGSSNRQTHQPHWRRHHRHELAVVRTRDATRRRSRERRLGMVAPGAP